MNETTTGQFHPETDDQDSVNTKFLAEETDMESQSERFERIFKLELSDFKNACHAMGDEERDAFWKWTIHFGDQLHGEAGRAQEETAIYDKSLEILWANGLATPGTTVGDVLPLLTAEERSIVDQAQQIYEKSFGVSRSGS